jgi:MobA/MobL family
MAHLHFKRTVYKSGGSAATQRLEYITRQPAQKLDAAERRLRYIKEGREDLVFERSRNLPAWAQDNPHVYFQAAERYEGKSRVAFEEWKISLPVEFSHRENVQLTHDLVEALAGDRLPITYAFHDPTTMDGSQQQPHLHLLISARQTDGHSRTPAQHFKRYNRAHPERGGAEKDPAFWHMGGVKAHRVLVADILNTHLEQAGQAARVHPDRLSERGIDRQPEPKLLPSESREYREQGIVSTRMQQVLDMRAERAGLRRREQNDARSYWEGRKAALGITRDMPMPDKLERIREARTSSITHAPDRPSIGELRAQERALEQGMHGLERHVHDLQHYARREQRIEQRREIREWRGELSAERVLANGKAHGLPRDRQAEQLVARLERTVQAQKAVQQLRRLAHTLGHDEPQQGAALHIRLCDREEERAREQDRGIGW